AHIADTLKVGCGLSEIDTVERVVRGGPEAVRRLVALGAEFDRRPDVELQLSREGGHTHARIAHARGDATGVEIQRAMGKALVHNPDITTFANGFAIDRLSRRD